VPGWHSDPGPAPLDRTMNPLATYALASHDPVTDEAAAFALGEFFQTVLETDGIGELRRLYVAFYMQAHGVQPPIPVDWSDSSGDGDLNVKPPMAAANGR